MERLAAGMLAAPPSVPRGGKYVANIRSNARRCEVRRKPANGVDRINGKSGLDENIYSLCEWRRVNNMMFLRHTGKTVDSRWPQSRTSPVILPTPRSDSK